VEGWLEFKFANKSGGHVNQAHSQVLSEQVAITGFALWMIWREQVM
jgi:hypothetical protein